MVQAIQTPFHPARSAQEAPCFVTGTMIETPGGPVMIETLSPGDLVQTRDNGAQPLRWIGFSHCPAQGEEAPIVFEAGAMGENSRIEVSPNQRILVFSARAELLFGESEVLVKARHLLNGSNIHRREGGGAVTYVHMLFDRHEIITGNGLECESYHPGEQALDGFDADSRNEILRLMPNNDGMMGYGYGPVARVALRGHECRVLLAG